MENLVTDRSSRFSVRVVKAADYIRTVKNETVMSRQFLRSGTSIGANIAESQQAQSRADFVSKLSIALKETAETEYWIKLLYTTGYFSESQYRSIFRDCIEVKKLLVSILKSAKKHM